MTNYDDCKKFCVELVKRRLQNELCFKINDVPWCLSDTVDFQANDHFIRVEPQIAEKIGIEDAPCYMLKDGVCKVIETVFTLAPEQVWIYFVDAKAGKIFERDFEDLSEPTTVNGRNYPVDISSTKDSEEKRCWHQEQFNAVQKLSDDDLAELRKFYTPEELDLPKPRTFKDFADDYLAARQKYFDESQRDLKKLFEWFWDGEQRG